MRPRDTALAFVQAFCAGDLAAIEALLAEALSVEGPLARCRSRAEYMALLRASPPEPARFDLLHAFEDGTRAGVFYRYEKPGRAVPIAQYCEVESGRITALRLYFDAGTAD